MAWCVSTSNAACHLLYKENMVQITDVLIICIAHTAYLMALVLGPYMLEKQYILHILQITGILITW